jgi:tetratricopeptide (TPR) repeat protein
VLYAHRLFGHRSEAADILGHAPFLERARTERARDRHDDARSALGAYLVARLIDRLLTSDADSAGAAEAFKWQLDSTRRFLADLPAGGTEAAHLAGIVDAVTGEPRYRSGVVRVTLNAYAYFLEHEGRIDESLDVLGLSAATWEGEIPAPEFVSIALFAGRLNRLLARWDAATTAYRAGCEAAVSIGDLSSVFRARLGWAKVTLGQGNLPGARAAVEAVLAESEALEEMGPIQAMAYAELGAVLTRQGRQLDAVQAMYEAFRRTLDPVNQMRVLGDLGLALKELQAFEPGRLALEAVAESNVGFVVRTNACIELMELEALSNNRIGFERWRTEARESADRMPPSMAIDYRAKAGMGLARFGAMDRAVAYLREGLTLAESHGLNQWYFTLERMLEKLQVTAPVEAAPAAPPQAPCELETLTAGLREFASAGRG